MLVPLLLAMQDVEVPRTVNGAALGTIESFQNGGPARICLENSSIDLLAGETATLQYAGIHSASLLVTGPDGTLLVSHGDNWAGPRHRMKTVWANGGQTLGRAGRARKTEYYLYGPSEYSEGARLILKMRGTALRGDDRDLPRLRRVTVHARPPADCQRRYTYGWDMLMGEEPLSTGEDK